MRDEKGGKKQNAWTLLARAPPQTQSRMTHSLMDFVTGSSRLQNVSDFFGVLEVDGVSIIYCDNSNKIIEPRQDWMKLIFGNNTEQYTNLCFVEESVIFRNMIQEFMRYFNHRGGVHILKRRNSCEWGVETGEINSFNQYGYDGEDFLSFDLQTVTWIATSPQAVTTKLRWEAEKAQFEYVCTCPDWLKKYLKNGNSTLLRKVFPSISLLWKTPSSPVSCHATGFYPQRAMMFWRKDGVEIHEGVDPGEILPNNDGTFQMSVGLNVSSVTPGEWKRYECVFQFSNAEDTEILIIAAVVVLVVIIVAVTVIAFHKMKEGKRFKVYRSVSRDINA
uniref:Ig-like domain-containing protein n=1 Tax=Neolamprologus brichardi TaxID=32507 RepID=A0A3Q4H9U7_NEOBR